MRIQFQNIAYCEWVHLLPSITFHIKGWREGIGIFRRLFPKDKQGFQILIHWLWFEILIDYDKTRKFRTGNKNPKL
jgi:hypothetical protein